MLRAGSSPHQRGYPDPFPAEAVGGRTLRLSMVERSSSRSHGTVEIENEGALAEESCCASSHAGCFSRCPWLSVW
jgi:hypothetical protein